MLNKQNDSQRRLLIVLTALALITLSIGYDFWQKRFMHHIVNISHGNTAERYTSELWLKSCPTIDEQDVWPNSIYGVVIAAREDLAEHFEVTLSQLVNCNYDIEQRDNFGLTPVHTAILYADLIALQSLIKLGANPNAILQGESTQKLGNISALNFAKHLERADIVTYLSSLLETENTTQA